ncbi:MAG TPA: MFS transporter, partial [Cytophagaceae bacterium]
MNEAHPHDPYSALRIGEFRLFISSRFLITLSVQIQGVVVAWQLYALTNDPLTLGFLGLAEALPAIAVALYAGHIADIINRKKIVLWCILLLLICSLSLFFLTLDIGKSLLLYGALPFYSIIFLSGIARGFFGPAIFSFMPQLIPSQKLFGNAVTWNSTIWQTAALAGPALGGILYSLIGLRMTYLVDCLCLTVAFLLFMAIKSKPIPQRILEDNVFERVTAGINFVFKNKIILSAMSLDLFAVLFGGAIALLPVYAKDILHVGPSGLGILRAAPAIGAVLIALFLAHNPIKKNPGKKMLASVAGFGICMILFGISTNFLLSLGILILSGMFDSVSVIVRSTLIHTHTPEAMKGRVSAVNNIFIGSSNEIGAFESGFAARLMGVVP